MFALKSGHVVAAVVASAQLRINNLLELLVELGKDLHSLLVGLSESPHVPIDKNKPLQIDVLRTKNIVHCIVCTLIIECWGSRTF